MASLLRITLFSLLIAAILFSLLFSRKLLHGLLKFRIPILIVVVVICVCFNVSGSSIAALSTITGDEPFQGVIAGMPRSIRSDEWLVFTPFSFSQAATGYKAISPVVRGGGTDMTMVYAQPTWSLSTIFRPFLWGYLAFGATKGLSFYWAARTAALLLVTYQLCLFISHHDESLSLLGSLLVTFSPAVQWWFAVNGSAELLIFGQGLVLSLHGLLQEKNALHCWLFAALMSWMMGCYLLILYPAWQIPFFYIFLAIGIWVILKWITETSAEERSKTVRRILPCICVSLSIVFAIVGICFFDSRETVAAVMNTAYPGKRDESGGGLLNQLPCLTTNLAAPIDASHIHGLSPQQDNPCEAATYMALFPVGLILSCKYATTNKDKLLVALLSVYAALGVYGIVGFPHFLSRALLLNNVPSFRLSQPLGFIDVLLLIRSETDAKEASKASHRLSLVIPGLVSIFASALLTLIAVYICPEPFSVALIVLQVCVGALSFFAAVAPSSTEDFRSMKISVLIATSTLVVLAGLFVNPLQIGTQALTSNQVSESAEDITEEYGSGLWVAESQTIGQVLAASGNPTLTSVNAYPRMDIWSKLDPDGKFAPIYNRYAYVSIVPAAPGEQTWFELIQADVFRVHISPDDLNTIGAKYWIGDDRISSFGSTSVQLTKIGKSGPYAIYHIVYR